MARKYMTKKHLLNIDVVEAECTHSPATLSA